MQHVWVGFVLHIAEDEQPTYCHNVYCSHCTKREVCEAMLHGIGTFEMCHVQNQEHGRNRLKRVILIGDHHQLPPVVKNMAIQKYSQLDQSLFTRFIRLGTPYIELNAQVMFYCAPTTQFPICLVWHNIVTNVFYHVHLRQNV